MCCLFCQDRLTYSITGPDRALEYYFIMPLSGELRLKKSLVNANQFLDVVSLIGQIVHTWPQGYKTFSCATRLKLKFILLINVKMPTIVGILTFMSRINYQLLNIEPDFAICFDYFKLL